MNVKKMSDEQLKKECKALKIMGAPTIEGSLLDKIMEELTNRGYAIGYDMYFTKEL